MKDILVSINNSSESFEKTIGLIYTNMILNYNFYDDFEVYVFFGNNLPKKNKNLNVSGTLGFYNENFQNYTFNYSTNINDLWANRANVLQKLINDNILSTRRADKVSNSLILFNELMKNMPITYLYPDFYNCYMSLICNQNSNIHFISMDLFDTYIKIFEEVNKEDSLYKIYALASNGDIGVYNLNIPQDQFYERNKLHFLKSLRKSIVLSGNSGVFLYQIKQEIEKLNCNIIGYRNHKYSRMARDMAMNDILINSPCSIIEPKNTLYNSYFDKFNNSIDSEELANQVVLNVYCDFIKNNANSLKIGIKK